MRIRNGKDWINREGVLKGSGGWVGWWFSIKCRIKNGGMGIRGNKECNVVR